MSEVAAGGKVRDVCLLLVPPAGPPEGPALVISVWCCLPRTAGTPVFWPHMEHRVTYLESNAAFPYVGATRHLMAQ